MSAPRRQPPGETAIAVLAAEVRRLDREVKALRRELRTKPSRDHNHPDLAARIADLEATDGDR